MHACMRAREKRGGGDRLDLVGATLTGAADGCQCIQLIQEYNRRRSLAGLQPHDPGRLPMQERKALVRKQTLKASSKYIARNQ